MNAEHARFAQWDAAYVLGALSVADRTAFETHLEGCAACRAAVAELAPTAGLLARVSEPVEPPVGAPADAGADSLGRARFLQRARARGRRLRWVVAAVALVLAMAGAATPAVLSQVAPVAPAIALHDVSDAPLRASVRLTSTAWGTRIDLDCRYLTAYPGQDASARTYALAVVGADGTTSLVSTWRIGPGASARLSAATAWAPAQIRAIEIRSEQGQVLMRRELPAASG